jgi:protein-S-isoprenylcysteine O-methyltransferase Ste14
MAVAALALYGVWAVVAFGVRTVVQLRRTGDTGFRGLSGRAGSVEWWAGVLFCAALAAGLVAPVLALTGLLEPFGWLARFEAGGVVVAVAGIMATFGAQLAMGDAWRIGVDGAERTPLVTAGPFRVVRNPIFSAMAVTAAGLTLMVPNPLALGGLVALVIALELQVRVVEEPHLFSAHGTAYATYAAGVGRFVPYLGRLRVSSRTDRAHRPSR